MGFLEVKKKGNMMNYMISVFHKRIHISLQILNVFWYYILRRIHPFIYVFIVYICVPDIMDMKIYKKNKFSDLMRFIVY